MILANLLPHAWFTGQSTWLLLLITVIAIAAVIKGADLLVEGAAGLAARLGMPKIVIGATIVSLGTTSPEMAVSVLAAWSGNAGLALGNGVGSIIADTGLIFGVGCLLIALPADRFILNRQGWVQFGSGVLLAGICYVLYAIHGNQATLGRGIGVLFVALLVWYLFMSIRWARQHNHRQASEPEIGRHGEEVNVEEVARKNIVYLLVTGFVGLAVVVFAGDALVQSVSIAATNVGVSQVVIASTFVALGTSLPELVVGITAIRKGHAALLVGNVIGADILNVLFVIGLSALAAPLPIIDPAARFPAIFLILPLPTMLIMLVLFRLFIFKACRDGQFSRWMGVPLVGLYVLFVILNAVLA